MARKTSRAALKLTPEERWELERLSQSRTEPQREVERASILLRYTEGVDISQIKRMLQVSRPTIYNVWTKPWPRVLARDSRTAITGPMIR